ncbi:MAG: PEP-CTERM sorting domain-containing protein [Alphaproteobacteria bacterium]|nr:PEP-CTERM sorting domain-containing protein [Alphaproteobacteria bacterium]
MKILRTLGVSCVAALMSFQAQAVILTGDIDVFTDSIFTSPAFSYVDGATLFSQTGISGTLEAGEISATIDAVSFTDITLTGPGSVVLMAAGAFSIEGVARNLAVNNNGGPSIALPGGPMHADFSHDVNTTLDLQGPYTLSATLDVTLTIDTGSGGTTVVQSISVNSGSFDFEGGAAPAIPAPSALLLFAIGAVYAGASRRKTRA